MIYIIWASISPRIWGEARVELDLSENFDTHCFVETMLLFDEWIWWGHLTFASQSPLPGLGGSYWIVWPLNNHWDALTDWDFWNSINFSQVLSKRNVRPENCWTEIMKCQNKDHEARISLHFVGFYKQNYVSYHEGNIWSKMSQCLICQIIYVVEFQCWDKTEHKH